MENAGASSSYQVYATHTMYVRRIYNNPYDSSDDTNYVRVTSSRTILNNYSGYTVTKMIQRYAANDEPYDLSPEYDEKTIYSPASGTYNFYPSSTWLPKDCGGLIQTSVEIFVNGTSFSILNNQPLSSGSYWGLHEC